MTAQYTAHGEPAAAECAVPGDRLHRIGGAGRMEPTARAKQRADPALVATKAGEEGAFDHGALMRSVNVGDSVHRSRLTPDVAGGRSACHDAFGCGNADAVEAAGEPCGMQRNLAFALYFVHESALRRTMRRGCCRCRGRV